MSLVICTANQYCSDKVEKNEMGGACSTYRGEEMCIPGFGVETGGKDTICKTCEFLVM